jgi:hypothetical protein
MFGVLQKYLCCDCDFSLLIIVFYLLCFYCSCACVGGWTQSLVSFNFDAFRSEIFVAVKIISTLSDHMYHFGNTVLKKESKFFV